MKKDVLLLKFSFVTYMDRKDHIYEECKYTRFVDEIENAISNLAAEYGLEVDCSSNSVYAVGAGLTPDNSGRCAVCNDWVSAINKEEFIEGLGSGAEFNGTLYCSQHLPKESPMYKKFFPVWEREEEV